MPKKSPYPDVVIPNISFSEFVFSKLEEFGDDVAIIDNVTGESLTFQEIYSKSRRLAAALYQRGLKKGDVVGICAPSCVQYPIILLATSSCGAALTTCNPDYTAGEILLQFRLSKPVMVFTHMKSLEQIEHVAEDLDVIQYIFPLEKTSEFQSLIELIQTGKEEDYPSIVINPKEDVLLMPYSSGTTGLPKCVIKTHSILVSVAKVWNGLAHLFRTSCCYSDRPMFHAGGLWGLLHMFYSGCRLVTDTSPSIHANLQAIEKYKVTHSLISPPTLIALSNNFELFGKYDLSSLKILYCGGASVPAGLIKKVEKKLSVKIQQVYGMTECIISIADPVVNQPDCVGMITSNAVVKVVDLSTGQELGDDQKGEILVNAPYRMIGYYGNPEATANAIDKDGFLHTGDIGHYNKDGMLFVTGRLKEVIKYRTFQVPPAEIEEVLLSHPKIADVGVIGIEVPEAGEIPRALIVKKDESLTEDEVIKHVANQLSDHKHLRGGVQFVETIPKSILGKILRQELKRMAELE